MTIDPAIMAWATEHWWLAFWLAWWTLVFGYMTIAATFYLVRFVINRPLRTIKVLARGWPPAHLDADGDWKPEPKSGPLLMETSTCGSDGTLTVERTFGDLKDES